MTTTSSWSGTPAIKGSTQATRMALLTFSLIGLQFTWGIEMTYCTPYLLQLGLTKSRTSLVWLAGPLSGLIMQPIVGAIADRSTSKYGRRRPYMVVGSIIVGFCLLLLGWTAEVVGYFIPEGETKKNITILVAVFAIYAVDFAINAVQACCRSLIVDTLPIEQQQAGSAWAARMSASGHVIGYFIGSFDLVTLLPSWIGGDTQFKKMTLISASGLWFAVGTTCWAVTERRLLTSGANDLGDSVLSVLPGLWRRTLNLPPRIQAICWSQFWGWIGWFPFLFYSSTWVGETYYRYEHAPSENETADNHDALGNIGRLGSLSLVIFSLITFTSSVILPYLVRSAESSQHPSSKFTPRLPTTITKSFESKLIILYERRPDLVTTWMISNFLFAAIMMFAPWVRSLRFATTLVALAGVPWAVSCWAPFSELGIEINKMSTDPTYTTIHGSAIPGYTAVRASVDEADDHDIEMEESRLGRRSVSEGVLRLRHPEDDIRQHFSSTGELAGVYLGVLNVYTTLPQFVGTFVSWVIFSILEPDRKDVADDSPAHQKWLNLGKNAPNPIAVCLFIGAICAVVAAEATRRLRKLS